jgi:hypothetical protein
MMLTARVLCLLACFPDVAASLPGSAADRAASPSLATSSHQGRSQSRACTIGDPGRTADTGRESEDAADLEDESDNDDGSDDVSLPWPFTVGGAGRPSLTQRCSVAASGSGSTHRSVVLRC